jgi:hypothetical protein
MAVIPRALLVYGFEIRATPLLHAFQGRLRLPLPAGAGGTQAGE